MNKNDVLLLLDELLELDLGSLKGDELLENLDGWDSMAVVGLMGVAHEKLELILEPAPITSCQTVNDIVNLLI